MGLWEEEAGGPLGGHSDWVRDVAWAPSLGLPRTTLASAGQDGQVCWGVNRQRGGGGRGQDGQVRWGGGGEKERHTGGERGRRNWCGGRGRAKTR